MGMHAQTEVAGRGAGGGPLVVGSSAIGMPAVGATVVGWFKGEQQSLGACTLCQLLVTKAR